LLALGACPKSEPKLDDDPGALKVRAEAAAVKSGAIGAADPDVASYVLVDVDNPSDKDRLVTLEGRLGSDPPVALGADELRVPAHGRRTFALVADRVVAADARPTFTVLHAVALDYPPPIELGAQTDKVGDLFVATASAKNTAERAANVVFACTYYGADGQILARPFTVVELAGEATQALRFEGPKEAKRAVIFVGQVAFKP
jgi:hypothetical protein